MLKTKPKDSAPTARWREPSAPTPAAGASATAAGTSAHPVATPEGSTNELAASVSAGDELGPEASIISYPHMLPKVMVPHVTKPGSTPRQIEIQRRRRLYACQDIAELVAEQGLSAQQLPLQHPDWASLAVFDDTVHETRQPHEWMPDVPGAPKPVGKVGYRDAAGSLKWAECIVHQHASNENKYLVQLQESSKLAAGRGGPCHCSPTSAGDSNSSGCTTSFSPTTDAAEASVPLWVPRVQLCFAAEDPAVYAKRLASAWTALQLAEKQLACELCVDSMPVDDVPQLTTEQVNRVLAYALNSKKLKDKLMDASTSTLITEANLEHAQAINRVTLQTLQAAAAAAQTGSKAGIHGSQSSMGSQISSQLLPLVMPPVAATKNVPAKGTVEMPPGYNFTEQLSEFSFKTLLAKPEVIHALGKIRAECSKVLKMCSLFNTYSTKSVKLEEFEQLQVAAMDSAANHLRDNWAASIKNIIKTSFEDAGKGWYNLAETNYETAYKFSKLRRFLSLVRFIMEDTLRQLAEGAMTKFVGFMQDCCCESMSVSAAVARSAGDNREQTRKAPLLLIELLLAPNGATILYSTPAENLHSKIISVFDRAVGKLQGLSQLEPAIMDKLFWPTTPVLTAVHLQEEVTVNARAALAASITAALQPMSSFLTQFRVVEPLLALNVEAYVEGLAAQGFSPSLDDISREVALHSAELEELARLPSTASLGLVQVNCTKLRDMVLNKKAKLIGLLKATAAKVPRSLMAATSAKFSDLERQVKARPGSIEEIDAQRRFIAELYASMMPMVTEVDAAKLWYSALDAMRYLLTEEDAREQLVAQGWPARLLRQAERSLEMLELDEAKLADELKLQQDDFATRIKNLAASIAGIEHRTDLAAATEINAEVAALNKLMQDAEAEAAHFNTRESILGWQPSDYSELQDLSNIIAPFLQFWQAATVYQASHLCWMSEAVGQLQGDAVEQLVTGTHKALSDAQEAFVSRGLDIMAANAESVRAQVEEFQKLVPLVKALSSPLQPRHWQQLSNELGLELQPPGKSFTLSMALQQGLLQHLEALCSVAAVATQEHDIQQALDVLQQDWEAATVGLVPQTGVNVVAIQVDANLLQKLDDSIASLQIMTASPHKGPCQGQLEQLESSLKLAREMLQQWLPLQQTWIGLLPQFASASVMQQQLPHECKCFATIDRWIRKTLDAAKRCGALLLKVWSDQKLYGQLPETKRLLEVVQMGLADYNSTQ